MIIMVLRVLRVSLSSVLAVHISTAIESSWPRAANTSLAFFSLGCEMLWNSKYEYLPEAESDHILEILPCSRYYLRSFSWTSRTFYFSDSRDLLEVLRGLPWQRERPLP